MKKKLVVSGLSVILLACCMVGISGKAAASSWTCGYGTFKAGSWPTSCWRPYADNSIWNTSLPANPKVADNSSAMVARTLGLGTIGNLTAGDSLANDYGHPTYYGQSTDPLFTVHCTMNWGTCDVEGARIRIPDQAKAAGGTDGHMTVVDQAANMEYDFWQVTSKPAGGGTLNISWGGKTRIDGTGLGSAATASGFGNMAGTIRAEELQAGVIPHALFLVVRCGSNGFVYPSVKADAICSDTTNAPRMGSLFYLDMTDAQIQALQVPTWKKTILTAMAHYGLYFGDTGGPGFGIQLESSATYSSFGAEDRMLTFAKNNGWSLYNGYYVGNLADGVDWAGKLKILDPCVAQQTCNSGSPKIGDFNGDGVVDSRDTDILIAQWKRATAAQDLNGDGTVSIYDLSIILSNYGS